MKSTDGGASWSTEIPVGSWGNPFTNGQSFAVAQTDSSIMFFGGTYSGAVRLLRSGDSGLTWSDITGNLSAFHGANDSIDEIWISPEDPDLVLVASPKGIFRTKDAGAAWLATSVNARTNGFAYYPAIDTLYAATVNGVYCSEDQGETWTAMNNGLGVLETTCIEVVPRYGFLYAGTDGGSVWRCEVGPAPFWANYDEVPETTGRTVDMYLNASPANAFRFYLIVGSTSGVEPGTSLPGGLAVLPVNWDWFSDFVMSLLNVEPFFANFLNKLDGQGQSQAKLTVPPLPPGWAGLKMHFAYCCNDPFDYASNPVMVEVADY
ncbi:MAG: hypothetical protein KJ645_14505 [Planctomycetes bacterium]|nr:hypothetical protein [Planctomycetota bacterium]